MSILASFSLAGKVAVITGGTRGIGKAIARGMAEAGATVVVASRKQEAVEATAQEFSDAGLSSLGIACHVGREDQLMQLVASTLKAFGRLDIVVNNAAVNPVFGGVNEVEGMAFDKIMEVNLKAPFLLAKHAYPYLKDSGEGAILNISSVGGIRPEQGLGIYSVSKAALLSLTKVQAKEYGRDLVRVNALCPGLIQTDFSSALWSNNAVVQHMMSQLPIQRIGQPEEMAGIGVFLCSPAASYITGAIVTADAGFTI